MAIQYSIDVRTAKMAAIEPAIGASPKLQLRTGAQPGNCAAADSGSLLAEIALPADWLAAASAGSVSKTGSWAGVCSLSGTVAHWRVKDASGTVCHMQGSASAPGGGGDAIVDNPVVESGQAVQVTAFSITAANS